MARPNIGYGRDGKKLSAHDRLSVASYYAEVACNHVARAKWPLPSDEEAALKEAILQKIVDVEVMLKALKELIGERGNCRDLGAN